MAGDVIYVDTGTYNLSTNVLLTAVDSGVTIEGPSSGTGAVFNRGDTGQVEVRVRAGRGYNVTLDHLSITGGYAGIYTDTSSNSSGLHVTNSQIYGNYPTALHDTSSSHAS